MRLEDEVVKGRKTTGRLGKSAVRPASVRRKTGVKKRLGGKKLAVFHSGGI
jgi:hypothetical protein